MPEVIINNLHSKTIHCKSKTEKLLDILLSETDWMHACGMKGRCTTCTAVVLDGMENLSDHSEAELRFIKLGRLGENERLSCQCIVSGDVSINTPELYKLPDLEYSE